MTVPPPSALGQRPRPPWVGLEPPRCDSGRGDALSKVCWGGCGGRLPGGESQRAERAQDAPRGRNPESRQSGRKPGGRGCSGSQVCWVGPQAQAPGVGGWRELRVAWGLCPGRAGVRGQT